MIPKKILIADDETLMLSLLRELLNNAGYSTVTASSGKEAVELAIKELPSLIMLDINMPGMDGLEACRIIKNTPATAEIPVIMLTAYASPEEINTALSYGAVSYITKPSAADEILQAVSSAVG